MVNKVYLQRVMEACGDLIQLFLVVEDVIDAQVGQRRLRQRRLVDHLRARLGAVAWRLVLDAICIRAHMTS